VVVNLDLADFFPSIAFPRVKGLFRSFGYGEHAATIFALLCTEPDVTRVAIDGRTYHVATSPRHLPQGAPTSPAITNLLCRRLDRRLGGVAARNGFRYTRYADDLTFSTAAGSDAPIARLLARVRWVLRKEGFVEHPDKTRVLRRGRRQEVTGLVVNDKLGVPRATLRRFRALLHQIDRQGPAGKAWGAGRDLWASLQGFVRFVRMVDPARAARLQAHVTALQARHG
jgi:retron-type reverse transcriptase